MMSERKRPGKGEPSAISPLVGEMSGRTEGGKPSSSGKVTRNVATPAGRTSDQSLFRKNALDEINVGRAEKSVAGQPGETDPQLKHSTAMPSVETTSIAAIIIV
ncbi:hypothetical protein BHMPCIPO_02185 [Ensifer sesbaniae]|nr:hypothetical protein [Ensifer sesbaniae]